MLSRLARLPLWAHAAALLIVLFALLPYVRTDAAYYSDEGQAVIQAHHLAEGDGWIVPDPLPAADPTGTDYPLANSDIGTKGVAPLAKHPTYPLLLAVLDRLGGTSAMIAASAFGVALAALLAALLAKRIDVHLALPTLWIAGLASPLFFDGFLIAAHTLAAACVTGALLVALRFGEREQASPQLIRDGGTLAGIVLLAAGAALLRTEAVLLGGALAAGVVVGAGRAGWRRAVLPAAALALGAGAARLIDGRWVHAIVGDKVASTLRASSAGTGSFLHDRVQGAALSLISPGYGGASTGSLLVVMLAASLGLATLAFLRRTPDETIGKVAVVAAAFLATARAFAVSPATIPGLLVAFPLLVVGALGLRSYVGPLPVRVRPLVAGGGIFVAAVAATQYADAGGVEWGGRYFAVGLPILVPVAVLGLSAARAAVPPRARRILLVAGVVVLAMLSVSAVRELHTTRVATGGFIAAIDRATVASGERPVILATNPFVPRSAFATFDRQRWLLVDPSADHDLIARLRAAGVTTVTLVTNDPGQEQRVLDGAQSLDVVGTYQGWTFVRATISR